MSPQFTVRLLCFHCSTMLKKKVQMIYSFMEFQKTRVSRLTQKEFWPRHSSPLCKKKYSFATILEATCLSIITPIWCALNLKFVSSNQGLNYFGPSPRQMVYEVRLARKQRCISSVSAWHSAVFYLN